MTRPSKGPSILQVIGGFVEIMIPCLGTLNTKRRTILESRSSMGSNPHVIMGQKCCHGQLSKVSHKDNRKLQVAPDKGIRPFTETDQDAADLTPSIEALKKAALRFCACIFMTKSKAKPGQVFVSLCHSSAAAGMLEDHCAMTWGELAKALNAFAPFASLQALRKIWCYTVENPAVGLTFHDFKRWF